ncbi:MAG TPA: hypothetical protein VGN86_10595 [Pyrinomonadaceae bacterium]|jgi:hypothetical protein|nr:hypothetical protein [Pyrinomonadaceae bacterium]
MPHNKEPELEIEEPEHRPTDADILEGPVGEKIDLEKANLLHTHRISAAEATPKWEREIDRIYRSYEFHLDFGLKAVGFYYAILGGILSIYFSGSGSNRQVLLVLLGLPIVLGFFLAGFFIYGGCLWRGEAKYMHRIAGKLRLPKIRKVEILSYLLWLFGGLFGVVAVFLIWLTTTVI